MTSVTKMAMPMICNNTGESTARLKPLSRSPCNVTNGSSVFVTTRSGVDG